MSIRIMAAFRNPSVRLVVGIILLASVLMSGAADNGEDDDNDISHGLGTHIAWRSLEEGKKLAKEERKPLMLIIHKSWCGACKSLKPKFKESKEVGDLSKDFIMVNTQDEDEPSEDIYKPDGGYIPRILFLNPDGEILKDEVNENGNPKYKYYYYDADSVLSSMQRVANLFRESQDGIKEKDENKLKDQMVFNHDSESNKIEL